MRSPVVRLLALLPALALLLTPSSVPGQEVREVEVAGRVTRGGEPLPQAVVYLSAVQSRETGMNRSGKRTGGTTVIDQRQLRFRPGVVAVRPGATVEFLNSDGILHNVFSPGWTGEEFDLGTYPSGSTRTHTFTEPGPHVILCHVHPEMAAYVVVVTTPHHAVTDEEGRFRIGGVPPGHRGLTVWRRGEGERTGEIDVPEQGLSDLVLEVAGPDGLLPAPPL